MSDVVGTCTDCIISVPNAKPLSLKYSMEVVQGTNLVLQNRGTAHGYYPSNLQSVQRMELAAGATYSPGTAIDSLLIATDIAVQVTIVRGTISTVFVVNTMLFLDDTSITNFMVSNPGATTPTPGPTANLFICYTSQ
jgi:hypothetical protein